MSFFKKLFGNKKESQSAIPTQVDNIEVEQAEEAVQAEGEQAEEVARAEAVREAEEAARAEALREAEEVARAEALREAEEVARAEALREAEEAAHAEAVREAEEVARAEAVREAEEVARAEAVREAEEAAHAEAVREAEEAARAEALREAEEAAHAEAVREAEEAAHAEALRETEEAVQQTEVEEAPRKKGFFGRLVAGLAKTRDQLMGTVDDVLKSFKKIDEDLYEELEEVLIMADFGVDTTGRIMEALREVVKTRKLTEPTMLKDALKEVITGMLTKQEVTPIIAEDKQNVILVIGVNGVGKTTSIGKLANQFKKADKKVVLAAADTFRAAAIEQLAVWADRAQVDLIKHAEGTDPAAVVFDGIQAAKARKADVLICDTAGRLQNKTNLMKELEKISRIIEREYPDAHKEVLIVLDATTGQNALSQVKVFKEVAKVDGIILTKLDGTAKGGAVVGICESLQVPVKYIGVGEKIEDLQVFDPEAFAEALFSENA